MEIDELKRFSVKKKTQILGFILEEDSSSFRI